MKNENRTIDALKMKDQVQAEVLKEISGLSSTEEIAFYRKAAENGPFADLMMRIKNRNKHSKKTGRRDVNAAKGSASRV